MQLWSWLHAEVIKITVPAPGGNPRELIHHRNQLQLHLDFLRTEQLQLLISSAAAFGSFSAEDANHASFPCLMSQECPQTNLHEISMFFSVVMAQHEKCFAGSVLQGSCILDWIAVERSTDMSINACVRGTYFVQEVSSTRMVLRALFSLALWVCLHKFQRESLCGVAAWAWNIVLGLSAFSANFQGRKPIDRNIWGGWGTVSGTNKIGACNTGDLSLGQI